MGKRLIITEEEKINILTQHNKQGYNSINEIYGLIPNPKKEIIVDDDKPAIKEKENTKPKIDGLSYLYDYIPKMSSIIHIDNNETFEDEYKTIVK